VPPDATPGDKPWKQDFYGMNQLRVVLLQCPLVKAHKAESRLARLQPSRRREV
jgi:hypothetical protein